MALVKAGLKASLKALADDPPTSHADAAQGWGDAIVNYATPVTPPSTTVAGGLAALVSAFTTAFATDDAAPAMEAAMAAFGATIAGGMLPLNTGTPPPGPVGFADLFSGTTDDTDAAADDVSSAIDDWMKTGIAVLVAPPNTQVNWS